MIWELVEIGIPRMEANLEYGRSHAAAHARGERYGGASSYWTLCGLCEREHTAWLSSPRIVAAMHVQALREQLTSEAESAWLLAERDGGSRWPVVARELERELERVEARYPRLLAVLVR